LAIDALSGRRKTREALVLIPYKLAPSQGSARLRRGLLAAAAQLARRHAATCVVHRRVSHVLWLP
jgi:hypothetical protein